MLLIPPTRHHNSPRLHYSLFVFLPSTIKSNIWDTCKQLTTKVQLWVSELIVAVFIQVEQEPFRIKASSKGHNVHSFI